MSRHQVDLVMCYKQPGTYVGKLCDKCDGRCPICDSYVRPTEEVRICDECAFGNFGSKCIICGNQVCITLGSGAYMGFLSTVLSMCYKNISLTYF